MRLQTKVALITGGGSGVGRATAALFAREGARVVVADLNRGHAARTAERIRAAGGDATEVGGDVSVSADAGQMVRAAVDGYGELDVLVNSAGVSSRNALGPDAGPEAVWDRVMAVNLKGTYLVSWHAVQEMRRSGGGSIINIASIIGLVGYRADIPAARGAFDSYPPSKGGVVQFTRNLAVHAAEDNIRVNCICPGYLLTSLTEMLTSDPQVLKALEQNTPMGRLGRPEEIAYAALYLASDESSFVTGVPLVVDGGYTAQ